MRNWIAAGNWTVNLDKVISVRYAGERGEKHIVRFDLPDGTPDVEWSFDTKKEAENALLEWQRKLLKTKGGHMFEGLGQDVRDFLKSNRDMIWTVIFVLLVDQFAFEGAFRERVKGLLDNLLKKAESRTLPAPPAGN